jgi:hypothetical protein
MEALADRKIKRWISQVSIEFKEISGSELPVEMHEVAEVLFQKGESVLDAADDLALFFRTGQPPTVLHERATKWQGCRWYGYKW